MDCDVFCMASNEGAYIADFIHHHLYKGFSNIFVGINHTSTDSTALIVEKICSKFQSVKIVDTSKADFSPGMYSASSYGIILDFAKQITSSKFFLPIDVDEFFMSAALDESVLSVISRYPRFDCLSLTYLDQLYAENVYSKPLHCEKISTAVNMWTKSITSYTAPIAAIGPHIPWFVGGIDAESLLVIDSQGKRRHPSDISPKAIVYGQELESQIPASSYLNIPFIFHQRLRSVLEYSLRCIRPWPGAGNFFYENRQGYLYSLFDSESTTNLKCLVEPKAYARYLASRNCFVRECEVEDLTNGALTSINADVILGMLQAIPREAVVSEKDTWSRTLKGTPFLEVLEQIEQ